MRLSVLDAAAGDGGAARGRRNDRTVLSFEPAFVTDADEGVWAVLRSCWRTAMHNPLEHLDGDPVTPDRTPAALTARKLCMTTAPRRVSRHPPTTTYVEGVGRPRETDISTTTATYALFGRQPIERGTNRAGWSRKAASRYRLTSINEKLTFVSRFRERPN
jgi:hypothetical protein